MALQFESSEVIDRPIDKVFHFFAVEHVRNHPRWDSDIELWLDNDAPLTVGTVIHRRNKRKSCRRDDESYRVRDEPHDGNGSP